MFPDIAQQALGGHLPGGTFSPIGTPPISLGALLGAQGQAGLQQGLMERQQQQQDRLNWKIIPDASDVVVFKDLRDSDAYQRGVRDGRRAAEKAKKAVTPPGSIVLYHDIPAPAPWPCASWSSMDWFRFASVIGGFILIVHQLLK